MGPEASVEEVAAAAAPVRTPKELGAELGDLEGSGALVAVFFAAWCPFCRAFLPTLDEVEAPDGVRIVQVDISDPEDAAWDDFGVETIPTAVRFGSDGEEQDRVEAVAGEGLQPDAFRTWLAGAV